MQVNVEAGFAARTVDQSQNYTRSQEGLPPGNEGLIQEPERLGAPLLAGKRPQLKTATSGERVVAFQAFWNLSWEQAGSTGPVGGLAPHRRIRRYVLGSFYLDIFKAPFKRKREKK